MVILTDDSNTEIDDTEADERTFTLYAEISAAT
jgi:hypothetical protein